MVEEGSHNFKRLRDGILALSNATDWESAKKEWTLSRVYQADEPDECMCGHAPIIEICVLQNRLNGRHAEVGNVCVKKFIGIRSDLVFAGIKRVSNDLERALNADAALYFFEAKVLNEWEYGFATDTKDKRKLSPRQMAKRCAINQKVLDAFKRRGLPHRE